MPKFSGGVVRLLAVVAAVWLFQPIGASLVRGAAGRDYPRCIQACNEIRKACDSRCVSECTELYPGSANQTLRDACVVSCKSICVAESSDCKDVCRGTGGTNEEP